jgi:enoyl-CoA hydratase/carnithine racemase
VSEVVRYELDGDVAWVTIDRPEARNSLSRAVREGLFHAARRFNDDAAAKVLVVTGAGDQAFCAGADLKEMADTALRVPPSDFMPIFGRNVQVAKPTIAAVNGAAYAGGFLLAQMCDLCVAAEHARFAISEVKVGRGAPWAVPLARMIPPRIAMQLLLTGDPIDAHRAHAVGLVNEVVAATELRTATQRLAERIAANAPLSVAAGKRMVTMAGALAEAYDSADRLWEPVYLSEDAQEGPRAFREKRAPRWRGV